MVQSPSWEANWFAASQEIPRISRNPKVHYRTHKLPPLLKIKKSLKYILNHVLFLKFNISYLCKGSKTCVLLLCTYPLLYKLKALICNVHFKSYIIFKIYYFISAHCFKKLFIFLYI